MPGKGGFARRPEHPYRVASLVSLSDELQQLAGQALPPGDAISAIFVIPEQMLPRDWTGVGGIHRVPEQALLFTAHGVVHAQVSAPDEQLAQARYLSGDHLFYARLFMILVYGRLELYGAVDGSLIQIIVEYNSVSQELIQPELYKLLRQAWQPLPVEKSSQNETGARLNNLELKSTKFCSGLRSYSLQRDERLLDFVFQPLIRKKKFGFSQQPVAPSSLVALTDRQLILIEEGLTSATSYGYFITFCPLASVVNIALTPNDTLKMNGFLQDLSINLGQAQVTANHRLTLENSNALAAQSLWQSH